MQTIENQFPPIAQALGRLRPALRNWPYAPKNGAPPPPTTDKRNTEAYGHDFLRILPEPALTGELPPALPAQPAPQALPKLDRPYWFDL